MKTNFHNVFEDSDVEDYPRTRSNGKVILSRLIACVVIGLIVAVVLVKVCVEIFGI
jgi:hypothetical protein